MPFGAVGYHAGTEVVKDTRVSPDVKQEDWNGRKYRRKKALKLLEKGCNFVCCNYVVRPVLRCCQTRGGSLRDSRIRHVQPSCPCDGRRLCCILKMSSKFKVTVCLGAKNGTRFSSFTFSPVIPLPSTSLFLYQDIFFS